MLNQIKSTLHFRLWDGGRGNLTLSHPYIFHSTVKNTKSVRFSGVSIVRLIIRKRTLLQKTNNKTFAILCTLPPEEKSFTVFVIWQYGPSGRKRVKSHKMHKSSHFLLPFCLLSQLLNFSFQRFDLVPSFHLKGD